MRRNGKGSGLMFQRLGKYVISFRVSRGAAGDRGAQPRGRLRLPAKRRGSRKDAVEPVVLQLELAG